MKDWSGQDMKWSWPRLVFVVAAVGVVALEVRCACTVGSGWELDCAKPT